MHDARSRTRAFTQGKGEQRGTRTVSSTSTSSFKLPVAHHVQLANLRDGNHPVVLYVLRPLFSLLKCLLSLTPSPSPPHSTYPPGPPLYYTLPLFPEVYNPLPIAAVYHPKNVYHQSNAQRFLHRNQSTKSGFLSFVTSILQGNLDKCSVGTRQKYLYLMGETLLVPASTEIINNLRYHSYRKVTLLRGTACGGPLS
jgi:hypothetical protein